MAKTLQDLLTGLKQIMSWTYLDRPDETVIEGISFSSKEIKQNFIFVCISGYRHDGHDFVNEAIHNGAVAVIAERPIDAHVPVIYCRDTKAALAELAGTFYDHPSTKLRLHGVTGTNGKTTTTSLAHQLFDHLGMSAGLIGTLGVTYSGRTVETSNTTPDALTINRYLAQMVASGVTDCLIEVSSQAIAETRIAGLSFNTASFLNLSHDHLDYHGTMETYAYTKAQLFAQITDDGSAIVNRDDPNHVLMQSVAPAPVRHVTFSRHALVADLYGHAEGDRFVLTTDGQTSSSALPFQEDYNLDNALCALSIVRQTGVPLNAVLPHLTSLRLPSGRLERVTGITTPVYIDYGHTPDAIAKVIAALTSRHERVLVLLSAAGERDRTKREIMTDIVAASGADFLLTVHDPRHEDPQQILDDLAGRRHDQLASFDNREDAIRFFCERMNDYDCGVIFGKGHDRVERVKGTFVSFDEPTLVRQFFHDSD
ncbi:UDP-N-acetylmuramoyl-L-alanyl-D-glutamate--2,6-diaminopimelate ligase [Exiguobacterium sp. SH0S2]|uniref:UDP-N-acetylmuramoyl-L-alanyl-D-glutamate--2, 6-diaminopimelate ligase n=1 Tax=Exiguobacterium sp. SH0S2 TaxID=2510950 RepID=UPI00103A84B7|nr:UDP-N-acetylmuramoyl-L-alanyl-D-glutamate--2,6-diaminopimelate ligase [Exiguobacterium sp. SH0S2]TCI63235.1 UDP-N-acetylmuramoyl-L-alanyl-D-glutamate--2,6-diaminopimelate ligase [Exiguobacterium sp. SH0S2]